jgi:hypothetical protein
MSEHDSPTTDFDWRLTSFEGARREQLRRWAQLPLEDILLAIEEMKDIAHVLGTAQPGVSESPAEYGKGGADQERDDDRREGS